MSGGLIPSKSTVYISNLPFDLKTNDIHKLFEKHGKIVKVTVLKDRESRRSKGVAFLLFLDRSAALKCVEETDSRDFFGRTLKASIARDNGRSTEFIRRRDYPDKSRCYECGEEGHLSYKCGRNLLGEREPPPKKVRKRKNKQAPEEEGESDFEDDETLSAAIAAEQEKKELEIYRLKVASGDYSEESPTKKPKRIKKSAYFSDEEESD